MEILETFPLVFCFPKSRINENGGNVSFEIPTLENVEDRVYDLFSPQIISKLAARCFIKKANFGYALYL